MSDDIRIVVGKLERFTAQLMTQIAYEVVAVLVETTPVDTGWARANWVPRVGSPQLNPVGSRTAVSQSDQAQGLASLAAFTLDRGSIFVTNNVPYIRRLNAGWSKQAPAGFIQSSIFRALSAVETRNRTTFL